MKWYQITAEKVDGVIGIKKEKIVKASPQLARFQGQYISYLFNWLESAFEDYHINPITLTPKEAANVCN